MLDYIRIACAVPQVAVGDVMKNAQDIIAFIDRADQKGADLVLFPELSLTGYTCGDLFFQDALWQAVKSGIRAIADFTGSHPDVTAVVGMPVRFGMKLYNCAAVVNRGEVCGLVPKTYLTASEKRWFAPANPDQCHWLEPEQIGLTQSQDYYTVPMKANQLFCLGDDAMVGVEICQDAMVPQPRCANLAVNGAEVILNLAASPELAGKRDYRKSLIQHHSALCQCVYAYASAGFTESTSDAVYSGHSLIAENGQIFAESDGYLTTDHMILMDCDLGKIRAERRKSEIFDVPSENFLITSPYGDRLRGDGALYPLNPKPYLPQDAADCDKYCMEAFQLQVTGLKQRLAKIHAKPVIGISGGLDSTLALLVALEAVRQLGRPASDDHGITMPCFGTTDRTYRNAWDLMQSLGITAKEIPIGASVETHFTDIGHDSAIHNGTYENAQARERTQVLMDYAGMVGGIVVGTGDLSELALGWCTYNGDHMSMYAVNASIPKTMIRKITETVSKTPEFAHVQAVLEDILATPISPELLPPEPDGKIAQQTEDLVGPYALHDFFLYYVVRYSFAPTKIYALACRAFRGVYDAATVKKWLVVFYRRFFTQQFKRSCMPEGIKVGSVCLSPRGDWRMPSDACARMWLQEAESL